MGHSEHPPTAAVRRQYERFPYPPVSALALPLRNQGAALRYEYGVELARSTGCQRGIATSHYGKRILVAGAGTLEPLVVAQTHPFAAEVVAVDLSGTSLDRLARRIRWARLRNLVYLARLRGYRLPPTRLVQADLQQWDGEIFDYILATHVLQHVSDPAALLGRLAQWLAPGGLLRVVTYPHTSRLWIRETARWLQWHGLTPETADLKRQARRTVDRLPDGHPVRGAFHSHRETATTAGLVDAFFHSLENPLTPLAWRQASVAAGLRLIGERQHPSSQSTLLAELLPATAELDVWTRLQIMDDLLELSASPILWFAKDPDGVEAGGGADRSLSQVTAEQPSTVSADGSLLGIGLAPRTVAEQPTADWYLPSRLQWELGCAAQRAATLLQQVNVALTDAVAAFATEVGQHVDHHDRPLANLSLTDYDLHRLQRTPQPWGTQQWQELSDALGKEHRLQHRSTPVPGDDMAMQAAWLQARYGYAENPIGPLSLTRTEHDAA